MDYPDEHVFQESDSYNCGPACLEMAYKRFGISRSIGEILADFHLPAKGEATYPPQIARDINNHGLSAKLTISNPKVISPAWVHLPKTELIENIKTWLTLNPKNEWHTYGLHLLFFLQDGGSVSLKSYTVEDLKTMLSGGSLLILGVDEVWLWGHRFKSGTNDIDEFKSESSGHFVIVDNWARKKFSVIDPFPTNLENKHGRYEVAEADLLNSSLIWAGTIVEIAKK